ncbi:putative nucleotide-binding alpha-beta plait domain superfamily [Dioscorea sansibarensis]
MVSFLSRYATFSKVEEAARCIQVVNGFILDGRPLKACFGAARYCESWLKKKPCKNRNCIYLHAVGVPEDTCTKAEVLAICSSSKLRQLGINVDYHQRRSGSCFPPPVENCKHSVTTFRPLPQSEIYGKCRSSKDLHPISDHGSSDFLQGSRWGEVVTFGRASYLNVVSQGLHSDSKKSGNSLSSKHEKVQISGQPSSKGQLNKELVMVKSHRLISDRFQENITSERPSLKNNYSETPIFQDIKAHVDTDSVLKYSGGKPSALSENDARVQTFVQQQVPSVKLESSKLQYNSHDSVDCSARMRLENDICKDHIFCFVPVSRSSSRLVTSTSESETLTANWTTKTAPIFQNVPLTADQFVRPSSSASCISTTQLEAENKLSLFDIQKVKSEHGISVPFSSDCVRRSLRGEQDNFQLQSESVGCRRETSKLLQGYVPSRHASSKDHIGLHSLPCQEDVNSKAVGMITCESDEGSGEVDVLSNLLSPDLGLIESVLDNSGLEEVFYNSSDSRHPSEMFSPGILSNNYASKFSFARIDTAGHLTIDFWQKDNAFQPGTFEENLIYRNELVDYPSDLEIASNSYLLLNLRKSATLFTQGNLPQPAKNPMVSNIDSNLLSRFNIDQRFTFQSELVNLNPGSTTVGQNSIKDKALQDALLNYCGAWSSCSMSSLTAAESVLLVRGSGSKLEEISRSDHANSHYDYSKQFHDHGDYNFQLPDTNCFYNVALEEI